MAIICPVCRQQYAVAPYFIDNPDYAQIGGRSNLAPLLNERAAACLWYNKARHLLPSHVLSIPKKLKRDTQPKNKYGWGYWQRLLAFFLVSLTIALAGLPFALGVLFMLGLLYAPCTESSLAPADYGLTAEPVEIPASAGGRFRGYFIPGANGAAIIMPPPFTGGRGARLPQAAMLARHGFAVLTFESRRCAGMGPLSLGYREIDEVADALNYLHSRADANPNSIGVYGFSSAGATAVMAAARLPQLCAVVAEGGYGNFVNDALGNNSGNWLALYFFALYRQGMRLTYWAVTGLSIDRLNPAAVIARIEPRPVLLIYGSREVSLPGGRQQQAAAGPNTRLWIVDGAGHGNYLSVAPQAYESNVVEFFNRALLEKPCSFY